MRIAASELRLLPALFALLWALPSLAQQVGVNTAVNPEASGTPPGGALRRLVLGQEVLYKERITTAAAGQTQIQFLDESSLTVGPNSDLSIDQFVYQPQTGSGELAITATRGIMRFVGGKLSKNDKPVTMQTPSATLAIRGGVFLANLSPTGRLDVVFLYGKELSVTAAGVTQTIPRPGFAVAVAGPGAPPSYPAPASRSLLSAFTEQLDGRPGGSGGAPVMPTDQTVAASGAPTVISGDIAGNIQAAAQANPTLAQPAQVNVAAVQSNLQLNTIEAQGATATGLTAPVVLPISGGVASSILQKLSRPTAPPFSGPYTGTITYPSSALQNGSAFVTPANVLAANPSLRIRHGHIGDLSTVVANTTGGATLGPLSAGSANVPVTLTVVGTYKGSSSFNGVSLNLGTVATGTATVTPDGDLFSANLILNGPAVQQLAPRVFGSNIFLFGGVPTVTMPTAGTGSYSGTAIGSVFNNGTRYTASGNFNETFNFASRTGTLNISSFDGADYTGGITGSGPSFTGNLAGPLGRRGLVDGSFFGPLAADVGGRFSVQSGSGPTYLASGIFTAPQPVASAVALPISGAAALSRFQSLTTPTSPPFSGPYSGTLTYPSPALQNGSAFVTPQQIVAANPSGASHLVRDTGMTAAGIASASTGGATLSPLTAGTTNAPVSLNVAVTYKGSGSFNGVSLNFGTVATGTATVAPDGNLFSANLTVNGASVQQLDPRNRVFGSSLFLFGGVPTVTVPTSGIGSFNGTANGTVFNSGAKSVASGAFSETFNFASRTGTLNISNFGGANYSAPISGFVNGYTGTLTGPASRSGPVTGTFFGPMAAETGGSFQLATPNKSFVASGVFTGR